MEVVAGGKAVLRSEERSSMLAIFKMSVEGSEPYAVARAAVRVVVSAPRAAQRSKRVFITIVLLRWTRPSSCGMICSTASSRSSFESRLRTRIVG